MNWLEDTVDRLTRGVSGTFAEEIQLHPEQDVHCVTVWGPNGYGLSLRWTEGRTDAQVLATRCTSTGEMWAWGLPDFPTQASVWMNRDQIRAAAFRLSLLQNNFADSMTGDHGKA